MDDAFLVGHFGSRDEVAVGRCVADDLVLHDRRQDRLWGDFTGHLPRATLEGAHLVVRGFPTGAVDDRRAVTGVVLDGPAGFRAGQGDVHLDPVGYHRATEVLRQLRRKVGSEGADPILGGLAVGLPGDGHRVASPAALPLVRVLEVLVDAPLGERVEAQRLELLRDRVQGQAGARVVGASDALSVHDEGVVGHRDRTDGLGGVQGRQVADPVGLVDRPLVALEVEDADVTAHDHYDVLLEAVAVDDMDEGPRAR